jgi:MFS superfamily sulfate permease-like transporter
VVIRLAAPLFFANGAVFSEAVKRAVTTNPDVRHVVLDLEAVTDIDVTGAEFLTALVRWLEDRSIVLSYSRPRPEIVRRLNKFDIVTADRLYPTNRAALRALTRPAE